MNKPLTAKQALENFKLLTEIHPTKNPHEEYVAAVHEICTIVISTGIEGATDEQWWLVDRTSGTTKRGPFKHAESAGAVRKEMERNATNEQNEKWNLCIESRPAELE